MWLLSSSPRQLLPLSPASVPLLSPSSNPCFLSLNSLSFPILRLSIFSSRNAIAEVVSETSSYGVTDSQDGPIELSPSRSTIFATSDEPTPLQSLTSLLLTGAITLLLFRSLRRRAKRARQNRFRSSGESKSLTEEALESLNSVTLSPTGSKSQPTPIKAFLGALAAGSIALILYKFTTTIGSTLDRQTISDNYSVRQITITVRTIINGLCYLATFVFGANSLGLFLYSGQLAINSLTGSPGGSEEPTTSSEVKPSDSDLPSSSEDEKTQ